MGRVKTIIGGVLALLLAGCAVTTRPPDAPPITCGGGGDADWTLAMLMPSNSTRLLAERTWDSWLLGNVVTYPTKDGGAAQFVTRIDPWAGTNQGMSLWVEDEEYEIYLLSASWRSCFYIGDVNLVFFAYDGPADHIYVKTPKGGHVRINPRGGP